MLPTHTGALPRLAILIALAGLAGFPAAGFSAEPPKSKREAVTKPFRKLVLAPNKEEAGKVFVKTEDPSPVQTVGLALFDTPEFAEIVKGFIGRPVDMKLVGELSRAMVNYAQRHDRLSLAVDIPSQDASTGVLRLAVKTGTYTQFRVVGNKWFSREQLLESLGVKEGEEILVSKLDEAIDWTNSNPFRRVQVEFRTDPKDASKTEALVKVQERIPFRTTFSYDNAGTEILGEHEFSANLSFGNLWGIGHQGTYDFRTSNKPEVYQGHSMLYRVPLQSRHLLQFQAAYAQVKATFNDDYFKQDAKNYILRGNYVIPKKTSWGKVDFTTGLDYKQANSDLLFRGSLDGIFSSARASTYDILQYSLGASTVVRDRMGAWLFGANLYLSPGNFNSRNSDKVFEENRPGADCTYAYGTLDVQRLFALPKGMEFVAQAHLQGTTDKLMGSEQMSIGGSATVRGYEERIYSGDMGATLNLELRSPAFKRVQPVGGNKAFLATAQLVTFMDFGKVSYHEAYRSDVPLPALSSTGLGLRCNMANMFSLNMDYGWIMRSIHTTYSIREQNPDGSISIKQVTASLPYAGRFTVSASLAF